MPPKLCASCQKTVFPMEELKCLDKTWHKGCFKCQVCNMTLNMKNYKGYHKLPYCNAHYPETKFTSVADTPEAKRLAQNSKIQSNIKYHEEYEKERGQYTAVADDPETLRVKKNMETISNVSYHGDLARRQEMESTRPNEYEPSGTTHGSYAPPTSYTAPPTSYTAPPQQQRSSTSSQGYPSQQPMGPPPQQGYGRRPGNVNDYDPMSGSGHAGSPYSSKPQSNTVYNSQQQGSQAMAPPPQMQPQMRQPPPQDRAPPPQMRQPPPQDRAPPQQRPPPQQRDPYYGKGKVSKSMYDYNGADDDEVSFMEDDIIIYCEPIDDGWMTGTVERTGKHGMLPSNYVEHLNW